jgi:hypothetical protein
MSNTIQNLQSAGMAATRVDGIDIGKLLHELGEASATTSATDLFGMCLAAQRVLQLVQAGSATVAAPGEAALLTHFRTMDDDSRDFVAGVARSIAGRFPRARPALTLVHGRAK